MPPTKAFTTTSSANCRQFARSPSRIFRATVIRRPGSDDRAAVGSSLQLAWIVGELAAFVELDDLGVIGRTRRDARKNRVDEQVLVQARKRHSVSDRPRPRCQEPSVEGDGVRDVARENQSVCGEL